MALPFVSLTPRHLLEVMSFTVNRIPSKALNGVPSLYCSVEIAAVAAQRQLADQQLILFVLIPLVANGGEIECIQKGRSLRLGGALG